MEWLITKLTEIRLNLNIFNKKGGFKLSRIWNPVTRFLLPSNSKEDKTQKEQV